MSDNFNMLRQESKTTEALTADTNRRLEEHNGNRQDPLLEEINEGGDMEAESGFIDILASDIMHTIDPVELAVAFHRCHVITRDCFEMCMNKSEQDLSRFTIFESMLSRLSRPCCSMFWHVVICILHENGIVLLADRLEQCIRRTMTKLRVVRLPTNSNTKHRFFYTGLRDVVEKGSLVNPRDQFAALALKRKQLLMRVLRYNTHAVRLMADKYASTLIIGLDIPPAKEDMDIFLRAPDRNMSRITNAVELASIAHLTTNPLLTQLILYSRMMLVYAFSGNTQMSENMLYKAKQLSYLTGACPELAEMYYFHVYYLPQKFEQHPTASTRNEIEVNVLAGLDILRVVNTDLKTIHFWQQFLLMKLISSLVGIGNHCNIIHNCHVTGDCITKARLYFTHMDDIWIYVETRRRMLYYLAKGRLEDICGNREIACHYIRKAIQYAYKGHFVEVKIMEDYLDDLTSRDSPAPPDSVGISPVISEIDDGVSDNDTNKTESVKSFQLFGDGRPDEAKETTEITERSHCVTGLCSTMEVTHDTYGSMENEYLESRGILKTSPIYHAGLIPNTGSSIKTDDLFDDGARCLGFDDDVALQLLKIERGEPEGMSNPD